MTPAAANHWLVETFTWDDPRHEAALSIRIDVFVHEQHVPIEEEPDHHDPAERTLHVLVRNTAGKAVATGRIAEFPDSPGYGRIGRMAVLSEARGKGAGKAVMLALMEVGQRRGYTGMILDAQVHAIPFYESCGFRVCGEEHMDCDIPHKMMEITNGEAAAVLARHGINTP